MAIALSKLTAHGRISVPPEIRKKLGVVPGSMLEWLEEGDKVIVRRAGRYSSADVHAALFSQGKGEPKRQVDTKDGISKYINKRHACR